MPTILAALLLALAPAAIAGAPPCDDGRVGADFLHDRVWLTPRIKGRELRFYTDTGGGWNAISRTTATELGLAIETETSDEGPALELVAFPKVDDDCGVPAPPAHFMAGRLMVVDPGKLDHEDGFLGGRWFADGVWEFDYPAGRLRRLHGPAGNPSDAHRTELGFQVNAKGERTMHFPRIRVTVDGEPLDMLFDTGATATLTATSAPVFGLAPGTGIGTSFIEREVFERWQRRHPGWRVLEAADQKGPQARRMIEVPEILVAGHRVGPVWFAEQPPGAFQKYMASMMDQPTWGALGGSGLKYFRVRIDYPAAAAYFQVPGDATPSADR